MYLHRHNACLPRRAHSLREAPSEEGQALVEFSLVLPVLLLMIIGLIKGGILFNNYLQLTDAVRTGARQLAISRGQTTPCGDTANRLIGSAGGLSGSGIAISMTESPEAPTDPPNATYTTTGPPAQSPSALTCPFTLTAGSSVTVQATYPCDFSFLGFSFIRNCSLTASATEQVE
jgi:Flp pilus assembly protein TadG